MTKPGRVSVGVAVACGVLSGCSSLPAWVPGSTAVIADMDNTDDDVMVVQSGYMTMCTPAMGEIFQNDSTTLMLVKQPVTLDKVELWEPQGYRLESAVVDRFVVGVKGKTWPGYDRGWPGTWAKGRNLDALPTAEGFRMSPSAGKPEDVTFQPTQGTVDAYQLRLKLRLDSLTTQAKNNGYLLAFTDASGRKHTKRIKTDVTTVPTTCDDKRD